MGFLIYKEQYSIESSEPSNLELLRKAGLDVLYSISKVDTRYKEFNEGLMVELINKMDTRERYTNLWTEVQNIYKEDDIKGLYLYYKKEEKKILWQKCQTLDKTDINEFILNIRNAELLEIFEKSKYQDYEQMFENITRYILKQTNRLYPKLFMY